MDGPKLYPSCVWTEQAIALRCLTRGCPTFEVPDPVRVGVVSREEGVVAELTKAVAALGGGTGAEEVSTGAGPLRDVVPDQQLAVCGPEHLGRRHSARETQHTVRD